jgi:hypothetical protein
MTNDLIKYNAAKQALAEAVRIDEVKDIRVKAIPMRLYAAQAKDRVLIDQASEIRLRAERRAGELLRDMEKNKGTRGDGRPKIGGSNGRPPKDPTPKLSDLDINKSQSSRWQKLAAIPDDEFEELVTHVQQKACASIDRAQQPKPISKSKRKRPTKRDRDDVVATCVSEVEMIVRAAIRGMDADEREGLRDYLERAVRVIMVEAAAADPEMVPCPACNGGAKTKEKAAEPIPAPATDDGLDIPDYLRRTPVTAA